MFAILIITFGLLIVSSLSSSHHRFSIHHYILFIFSKHWCASAMKVKLAAEMTYFSIQIVKICVLRCNSVQPDKMPRCQRSQRITALQLTNSIISEKLLATGPGLKEKVKLLLTKNSRCQQEKKKQTQLPGDSRCGFKEKKKARVK